MIIEKHENGIFLFLSTSYILINRNGAYKKTIYLPISDHSPFVTKLDKSPPASS